MMGAPVSRVRVDSAIQVNNSSTPSQPMQFTIRIAHVRLWRHRAVEFRADHRFNHGFEVASRRLTQECPWCFRVKSRVCRESRDHFNSDVSIYKSDFFSDHFRVTKFDFDFFDIRMRCYLTWLFSHDQFIKTFFVTNCQLCQPQFM
jgi:hypothetical protein